MLKLGDGFDQPLQRVVWPEGLKEVELGDSFDQDMEGVVWPKSLRRITAPDLALGRLPEGCRVTIIRNLEQQIEEGVESMLSHFMMMDAVYGFDAFMGIHDGDTDEEDDVMQSQFFEAMNYGLD